MEFTFTTTNETYEYCCEVVNCLMTYCKKSQEEALGLVNAYWYEKIIFDEEDCRLHEYPYYWAMCMTDHYIQGEIRRDWWHDPKLWPPPKEYLQKYNY
jgi:hypothetical protein